MARRQSLIILPKLYDAKGNVNERWFVYYSYRNPGSKLMVVFRIYQGFDEIKTREGRYAHAHLLIQEWTQKLRSGFNPFEEKSKEVIYDDDLQYQNVAEWYGKKRSGTKGVRYYLNDFLTLKKATLKTKSYADLVGKLRTFCLYLETKGKGDIEVAFIDNEVIQDFFMFLINEKELAHKTIDKYRRNIWTFFEYLIKRRKILDENPVRDTPNVPDIVDFSAQPFPEHYIHRICEYLKTRPQLWLAVEFQYYCGLRPGEVRTLQIKDIDFARGSIRVQSAHSKNKKTQSVLIPDVFMEDIRKWNLIDYPLDYYVFSKNGLPGPVPLGVNTMRERHNKIRKVFNLPADYKYYSWKPTAGIRLDEVGVPLIQISQHYRHSDPSITDVYLRKKRGNRSQLIKESYPRI